MIKKRKIAFATVISALFAVGFLFSSVAMAQSSGELAKEFANLDKKADATGEEWFDLASKARSADDFSVASSALDKAQGLEIPPIRIGLERARLLATNDEPSAAVSELQKLLEAGFTSVGFITADKAINSMAGRDDYDALIEEMSVQAYPCDHQDGFHDFDFWLGSWDVHVANGTRAGSNTIRRAERGCVLIENWVNTSGGTGMSVNYLDKSTDEWVQVWNAEGGSQINVRGGLTEDGMRMEGHLHSVGAGTTVPFRALWTALPDGRVRQFFEQSNDNGVTWVPWFEGFYTRTD
jgi:hypothetical protein